MREDHRSPNVEAAARFERDRAADYDMGVDRPSLRDEVEPDPQPCPECVAGKHQNCDGVGWDDVLDLPCECPCADAGHQEGADL